jgi:predicted HTH transcriptional regulator
MNADELPVPGSAIQDIDLRQFNIFLLRKYKKNLEELNLDFNQVLENLNLAKKGTLTLSGLLLFSGKRHISRPQFSVQCVSMDGSIIASTFLDNEGTFEGTLPEILQKTIDFIGRSMKKIPETSGFNSQTKWEIPYEVFEELLVNALVHRDYFLSSTVKVLIFEDRVEIISPGKLPNSVTVSNIQNGISVARNPILLSLAQYVLPYKGLGTGVARSYALYPHIMMENKVDENQFKVTIRRKI